MPLKLHAGLSKKVGLPGYGSLGASCHLEIELDTSLLARDPPGFQEQVQAAFGACAQAVQAELDRHSAVPDSPSMQSTAAINGQITRNGAEASDGKSDTPPIRNGHSRKNGRKATESQVRAIFAIGHRLNLDIPAELDQRFHVARPEDLSIGDASRFIDELQQSSAGVGGSR